MTSWLSNLAFLIALFYVVLFGFVNYEHFRNGYDGTAQRVTEMDKRFVASCKTQEEVASHASDACEKYTILVHSTPFMKGIHNLRDKAVGCGLWSCTELLGDLVHHLGFSVVIYALGIMIVLPFALNAYRYVSALMPQPPPASLSAIGAHRQHEALYDAYGHLEAAGTFRPYTAVGGVGDMRHRGNGGAEWTAHERPFTNNGRLLTAEPATARARWVVAD